MIVAKGANETAARVKRLERRLPTVLERMVGQVSLLVRRELELQFSGRGSTDSFLGRRGANPPLLGARTGLTRARLSPGGRVYRRGNEVFSPVGSPDRYVLAHEKGATISGNPYLRIPLAAAQTPGGQDRNIGRSMRSVQDVFVVKSKRGNLFLARRKGKHALEMLYLLKRSVRLVARGMFKAVTARVAPKAAAAFGSAVSLEVRRANNG